MANVMAEQGLVYRSHYRVCTAPPPPRRLPPAASEVIYLYALAAACLLCCPFLLIVAIRPRSLKDIAALAVAKTRIWRSFGLPADLSALVANAETMLEKEARPETLHMELKDRRCPTATRVRVGGFADLPLDALNRCVVLHGAHVDFPHGVM